MSFPSIEIGNGVGMGSTVLADAGLADDSLAAGDLPDGRSFGLVPRLDDGVAETEGPCTLVGVVSEGCEAGTAPTITSTR